MSNKLTLTGLSTGIAFRLELRNPNEALWKRPEWPDAPSLYIGHLIESFVFSHRRLYLISQMIRQADSINIQQATENHGSVKHRFYEHWISIEPEQQCKLGTFDWVERLTHFAISPDSFILLSFIFLLPFTNETKMRIIFQDWGRGQWKAATWRSWTAAGGFNLQIRTPRPSPSDHDRFINCRWYMV